MTDPIELYYKLKENLLRPTLLGFLIVILTTAHASAQTPFFQGKTLRIAVGYLAGDTHDLWARAYARNLGKHVPGAPEIIVQNMPGAGSMPSKHCG